jgi:hypothetical protein
MNYDKIKEKAAELSVMAPSIEVRILAGLVRELADRTQDFELEIECKVDDPKYSMTMDDVVKAHVETLPLGSHRIDEIAVAIGMKDKIIQVAQILRRMEGKIMGDRVMSSNVEGRRRLFTIFSHND